MTDSRSPTTRRRLLARVSVLLGASIAGCSALDARRPAPPSSATTASVTTTETTTTETKTKPPASGTTEPTTSKTTVPKTQTATRTPTVAGTTAVPDLNRTPHPAVQQRTDGEAIPARTVVLAADGWREAVAASKLADETVAFIDGTDFESSFVVGFEVEVTEWGYRLRLESVERNSDRVRIAFSDVLVEGGPNVEEWRAAFVRLPRSGGVPESVVLERRGETEPS